MPRDDTPMTVKLDKGHSRRPWRQRDRPIRFEAAVTIPGRSSLRFSDARMTLVDNARYEPEQILLLKSSSPVAEKALTGKVIGVSASRAPSQAAEGRPATLQLDESRPRSAPRFLAKCDSPHAQLCAFRGRRQHLARLQVSRTRGPLHLRVGPGKRRRDRRVHFGQAVRRRRSKVEPYRQALTFLGHGRTPLALRR